MDSPWFILQFCVALPMSLIRKVLGLGLASCVLVNITVRFTSVSARSICQSLQCPGRVGFPVLSQIKPQAPLLVQVLVLVSHWLIYVGFAICQSMCKCCVQPACRFENLTFISSFPLHYLELFRRYFCSISIYLSTRQKVAIYSLSWILPGLTLHFFPIKFLRRIMRHSPIR